MFTWSQESTDNLEKIAAEAVEAAQHKPGQWVNPLEPHLKSRVRYAQTPSQIQQFLAEKGIPAEATKDFAHTCMNGFFQVYLPKSNFLAGSQHAPEAAHELSFSWYEEASVLEDKNRYDEIVRLIKHMGGLETDKIRAIESQRCFIEPSSIPGFERFVSADRRFPVSVSYPHQRRGFFYDFESEEYLHVDWYGDDDGSLRIERQNLAMSAQRGDKEAKLVLQGKKDITQFILEDFARRQARAIALGEHHDQRKPRIEDRVVGESERPFEAKRLVWLTPSGQYGGEWVFFVRARQGGVSSCRTKLDPRTNYRSFGRSIIRF